MKKKSLQKGVSLIETMVALFVLAVGILGILSMQLNSLKANKMAAVYSEASYLANSLVESMRTTPQALNSYVTPFTDTFSDTVIDQQCRLASNACSAQEIADVNLNVFLKYVAENLPGGRAEVTLDDAGDSNLVNITIEFDAVYSEAVTNPESNQAVDVNGLKEEFVLRTII